ncbi:OLC1v1018451C1 [Oldenlandia corymbosa var. corymbosa]|uniref:OLC1v1018451C1 n=1 Tax=Oldenlandia corymbosa var. corymbosa TaxID=529605 RepID=A0AAV1EBP3_OLDCO|nr:OLC1v1018451C1 [Oldenlandia corymbosa var. corymbosa]
MAASNINVNNIQKLGPDTSLWAKFISLFFKPNLDDQRTVDTTSGSVTNPEISAAGHVDDDLDGVVLDLEAGLQQKEAAHDDDDDDDDDHNPIQNHSQPHGVEGGSLNTVAQVFKEQELGKLIMGFVMPLTTVFASVNAPNSLLLTTLLVLSLSVGFAAILIGILVRNTTTTLQRYAHKIEQFGAGCVVFAVYALIASFLPLYLQWLPWGCFLMIILVVGLASISVHKQN